MTQQKNDFTQVTLLSLLHRCIGLLAILLMLKVESGDHWLSLETKVMVWRIRLSFLSSLSNLPPPLLSDPSDFLSPGWLCVSRSIEVPWFHTYINLYVWFQFFNLTLGECRTNCSIWVHFHVYKAETSAPKRQPFHLCARLHFLLLAPRLVSWAICSSKVLPQRHQNRQVPHREVVFVNHKFWYHTTVFLEAPASRIFFSTSSIRSMQVVLGNVFRHDQNLIKEYI